MLLITRFILGSCLHITNEFNSTHNQQNRTNVLIRNADQNGSVPYIQNLKYQIHKSGACQRTTICFAFDGSGSISPAQYNLQVKFAETIASIIDVNPSTQFAAVQYGLRNVEISSLTNNLNDFRTSLRSSKSVQASRTFISAGIGGCAVKLRGKSSSVGNGMKNNGSSHGQWERKIVLLGDGRDNFGISPVKVSKKIEEKSGADLFAIGIGFPNVSGLKEIVGEADKFSVLNGYGDLELEKIVSDVVSFACRADME